MSTKCIWVHLNGPPWGFRMKEENKGDGASLVVSRVNSKGREQGLKEGDRVLSVNGQPTAEMTHVDAQRVIRESSSGIELQIERNTGHAETNGFNTTQNGNMADGQLLETRLNALDEEANHAGSWSTDSTSTGSTTIHVSSLNSDDTSASEGVWSPNTKRANLRVNCNLQSQSQQNALQSQNEMPAYIQPETPPKAANTKEVMQDDEKSPVWQPFGAPYEGPPQFRPVKLGPTQTKITTTTTTLSHNEVPKEKEIETIEVTKTESPSPSCTEKERTTSPAAGKPFSDSPVEPPSTSTAPTIFTKTGWGSHLPPSQSPTITLLQKAREGKIPKGAVHIEEKPESTPIPRNAVLIDQKVIVEGDKVHTDSYYAIPTLTTETTTTHTIGTPPKYDGIGPTEYGIPVGLRTGVKEEYASDWYKTMYKSLHRAKFANDSTKTVHLGGYMSEPEYDRKDKIKSKYTTDYRRKPEKSVSYATGAPSDISRFNTESNVVRHDTKEVYRVEPRSIAEYEPGKSSLAEKEFHKFWSDFWDSMDDLHEHLGSSPRSPRHQQGLNRRWPNVLLSDGYDSDSTLIRKTGRIPEADPDQQKAWYKEIQKGGEIPLTGLRKSAPEKPAAPSHKYEVSEVNIHYRSPIRHLEKEYIDEEELRKIQEDAMRKLYEEERRKKHQQELAEIEMRRHSDFFTPSQKSPIPLNRYDNPFESSYHSVTTHGFSRGPPPKTMARAIYPFTAQTTRELSLNKGDIIYITKQVDKNWYEGEHHGLVGIFPVNYAEIIPNEKANLQPRKALEGEALVKYNFRAQTPQELSLFKGEKVVLIRRMDHNWFEGRLGTKKGIFPISYVEVLHEPGEFSGTRTVSPKPPASPVFSSLISGSPPKPQEGPTFNTGLRPLQSKPPLQLEKSESKSPLTQSLHIDTYNEPIPYRALYAYQPQNDDELELKEGDTVYVMEKCDDGWYVGTSLRTGLFGTFPGNYVERI